MIYLQGFMTFLIYAMGATKIVNKTMSYKQYEIIQGMSVNKTTKWNTQNEVESLKEISNL